MSDTYSENKPKNLLMVDPSLCIGCSSCQAACQMEHDLPASARTVKVLQLGPYGQGDDLTMSFLSTACFHCDRPACVAQCPTGAMQKRKDGIVYSDLQICIGCQTCAVACPCGIPTLNEATGKIAKCDGCKERVDLGLWPACALKCPTGALTFGSAPDAVQDKRHREAFRIARAL
jgi:Fe-S-cluster-containing dehydrogenase component